MRFERESRNGARGAFVVLHGRRWLLLLLLLLITHGVVDGSIGVGS